MATTNATVIITVDSSALSRATQKVIEDHIAAAVEPAVKRELKKALAQLEEEITA